MVDNDIVICLWPNCQGSKYSPGVIFLMVFFLVRTHSILLIISQSTALKIPVTVIRSIYQKVSSLPLLLWCSIFTCSVLHSHFVQDQTGSWVYVLNSIELLDAIVFQISRKLRSNAKEIKADRYYYSVFPLNWIDLFVHQPKCKNKFFQWTVQLMAQLCANLFDVYRARFFDMAHLKDLLIFCGKSVSKCGMASK